MKQMNHPERKNRRRKQALARLKGMPSRTRAQEVEMRVLESRVSDSLLHVRSYNKKSPTRRKGKK